MAPARNDGVARRPHSVLKNLNASPKLAVHEAKRAISAHVHSCGWDGETERTWEGFYYFPLHLFRSFARGGLWLHTFVAPSHFE